jgi:hypothetical protein
MVADQTGELLAVAQDLGSDLKQVTFCTTQLEDDVGERKA